MDTKTLFFVISVPIVAVIVALGLISYSNNNSTTITEAPVTTTAPLVTAFDTPITIQEIGHATFGDGLQATVVEINDSRCKSGVVCVWQGEFTVQFRLHGGNIANPGKEFSLGTQRMKSTTMDGYTITLTTATETSATFIIHK